MNSILFLLAFTSSVLAATPETPREIIARIQKEGGGTVLKDLAANELEFNGIRESKANRSNGLVSQKSYRLVWIRDLHIRHESDRRQLGVGKNQLVEQIGRTMM